MSSLGADMEADINSMTVFDWGEAPANWWGIVQDVEGIWMACQFEPHVGTGANGVEYWCIGGNTFDIGKNVQPTVEFTDWRKAIMRRN